MHMTPMLAQYFEIKKKHKNAILFFRLGDFYEMFGDDAMLASKILNITLTSRNRGTEHEIPMCGVPHHAAENYVSKLTAAGKKVAICEQVSDPSQKGIVDRAVTRIITPGTTFSEAILERKKNHYLVSLLREKNTWGVAWADFSTGEFCIAETVAFETLKNQIFLMQPSEMIVSEGLSKHPEAIEIIKNIPFQSYAPGSWPDPKETFQRHFHIADFGQYGFNQVPVGLLAAIHLFSYLVETQKTTLPHLTQVRLANFDRGMILDETTIRNLELLFTSQTGAYEGSLISTLDKTCTAMGGRMLRQWMLHPLLSKNEIESRLDLVEEWVQKSDVRKETCDLLRKISDMERLMGKIGSRRASPRDILALKHSLVILPELRALLSNFVSERAKTLLENFFLHEDVVSMIEKTLHSEPPALMPSLGAIADGFDAELDALRNISRGGMAYLSEMKKREVERTKISTLKIKFNKVFGYYIEISKAAAKDVPKDYIRKQTLVNAERFVTPELKAYEEKILGAEEKMYALESKIFDALIQRISLSLRNMQKTTSVIAEIDVLSDFACLARERSYVRPKIVDEGKPLRIVGGRHPVIETLQKEAYIPNDLLMDDDCRLMLLTGPNMAGKSSFLRQNALIVLMAHMGAFVPASTAEIAPVDRIFTRVGASDNLVSGRSTFMVEMQEAAAIVAQATHKSFIILDEVGRGTSTYDGVAIAWALMEHLHDDIRARVLFATHYHELMAVSNDLSAVKNYCVLVKENDKDGVLFLRKVVPGGIDKSYGVEVAKLAGMSQKVVERAKSILKQLERDQKKMPVGQLPLPLNTVVRASHPVLEELSCIEVEHMTPFLALQKMHEWKEKMKRDKEV